MESKKCKGMRDLLPGDMVRFRHIEDAFRNCCGKYGYQEVRTPSLEYLHLFTAAGTLTPSMLGKLYSFLDWNGWSGERVVLRPDGTIPVARLYINNLSEHEIAKLFYVTNIFAFEETGRESRERWQCGAEFLGGTKLAADAETISLAKEVVHKLGLANIRLQLSHAGLVKALIKELKLGPGEEAKVTSRVLDGDWQALMEAKSTRPELDKHLSLLLSLKGKSSGFLQNTKALCQQVSSDFKSSMEDFINITTLLDSLSCNYEIDITAIRGFEYYTGICFQLLADKEKIGGGGRYDDLIPFMSGKNIPACGFALYIDPIMKLLSLGSKEGTESRILIKGEESTLEIVRTCFTLAQSLREAKRTVEIAFTEREPSNYRWVIAVTKKPSPFVLIDRQQKQRRDVASAAEILNILGR
ncbi:MAG: ATP phosphoribosyltransferase regulatory subunit [Dehalococcoidia bacterium]|nr:ATP phosphoribosyltransferase regulatory subunit [Dehalococcoidia bacterium]